MNFLALPPPQVLRISSSSRRQYTAGEIMNLMSVDVEQVGQFLLLLHHCWGVPLRAFLTMAFLWQYLGPSCLATVATLLLSTFATTCVARLCDKHQVRDQTFLKYVLHLRHNAYF